MSAKSFSSASIGLMTLCISVSAAAQLVQVETRFGPSETLPLESDARVSEGSFSTTEPRGETATRTRWADGDDQRPTGQYQRGRAIGINIVDSGQGKVTITYVHPDSPAEQVGLQPGDAIRRIDGRRVSSTLDVIQHIAQLRASQRVNLEVERAQRMQFFQVRLESRQAAPVRGRGDGPEVQFSSQRTVEPADNAYAYRAGYGPRQTLDSDAPGTGRPVYGAEQLEGGVPSNRVLMQEISLLRRQLSDVRQELEELRRQVKGTSRSDRRARDLQQAVPAETQTYQYDGS